MSVTAQLEVRQHPARSRQIESVTRASLKLIEGPVSLEWHRAAPSIRKAERRERRQKLGSMEPPFRTISSPGCWATATRRSKTLATYLRVGGSAAGGGVSPASPMPELAEDPRLSRCATEAPTAAPPVGDAPAVGASSPSTTRSSGEPGARASPTRAPTTPRSKVFLVLHAHRGRPAGRERAFSTGPRSSSPPMRARSIARVREATSPEGSGPTRPPGSAVIDPNTPHRTQRARAILD